MEDQLGQIMDILVAMQQKQKLMQEELAKIKSEGAQEATQPRRVPSVPRAANAATTSTQAVPGVYSTPKVDPPSNPSQGGSTASTQL